MVIGMRMAWTLGGVKVAKLAYGEPLKDPNTTQRSNHPLSLPLNANT